ncbi:MAG: prepilin-type N-terminal cleavage/methylation domain-containing protein [Planctomycetota bacterium]|nr:prepilin-type N-terminal cleavage/methylation domain-containing protein [Planctomycetota bacterium]
MKRGRTRGAPGITLVEMLVVLAILSVLLGLGAMSFFRASQKYKEEAAVGAVETALRTARNEALTQRAPAFVELDHKREIPRVTPWSYKLEGLWHFEEGSYQSNGAFGIAAMLQGCKLGEGKIGKGLQLFNAGPRGATLGYADCGENPAWDCENGGYLEAYVFGMQPFGGGQYVFFKRNCYSLSIGRGGVLTGAVGSTEVRAENFAIPMARWTKVALAWDRLSTRVLVDDAILAVGPGAETPRAQEPLLIGNENGSLNGIIDEVRVFSALRGKPVSLGDAKLQHDAQPWDAVFFAPDGSLDVRYHAGPITLRVIRERKVRPIFISMFGLMQRKAQEKIEPEDEAPAESAKTAAPAERPPLLPPKRKTGTIKTLPTSEEKTPGEAKTAEPEGPMNEPADARD